jgi:hypothetical protein
MDDKKKKEYKFQIPESWLTVKDGRFTASLFCVMAALSFELGAEKE